PPARATARAAASAARDLRAGTRTPARARARPAVTALRSRHGAVRAGGVRRAERNAAPAGRSGGADAVALHRARSGGTRDLRADDRGRRVLLARPAHGAAVRRGRARDATRADP